ncbi:MAG TPA: NADH-quinone oxidoreductase subunit NuoE [Clostridia bacterium]|jgi:NADP-reducing hydrogenase subunit HndA|nr:NADH-quinone oxidoreductase subunit NuoE [Clostridiaceae bacterium]HOF25878.1 NADH-quinone oxidoreductase subunit NuoE [Clostridia bacterium]HOM33679.1 NADH-quinone oxidoreductase subunit NuoE [Clostridia bacterium]HOR88903.1 NADH-quinone oxidoreductase subunit NuoE [Clostridia bacterium]HOT71041.1 NADH-quinone oxidoreductase subunit NuoE [Clostridia bacterium]
MCQNCNLDENQKKLQEVFDKYKDTQGALIPVLHEAQEIYGYLPLSVQEAVADALEIPLSEVYGVVTFYTHFSLYPKGKYKIQICLGTACYVKGANNILEELKKQLGIDVGQSTKDGKFSLDACRCVGACGIAPVMMINDDVYGSLAVSDVADILKKY